MRGAAATMEQALPALGSQVPFAETIKMQASLSTRAVGLIVSPEQAEAVIAEGRADLVAIGREALLDPNWPVRAAVALGADVDWEQWPPQYGWWLSRRAKVLEAIAQQDSAS